MADISVGDVTAQLRVDTAAWQQGLQAATQQLNAFARTIEQLADRVRQFGQAFQQAMGQQHWEGVRSRYRRHLEALGLAFHPFRINDSIPQSSTQVQSSLQAEIEAIDTLARQQQLPVSHEGLKKALKQLPALVALVDWWWHGVALDVEQAALSDKWRYWAKEYLLPYVYWEYRVAHTRCVRQKAKMRQALDALQVVFDQHVLTQSLPPEELGKWRQWAKQRVDTFQRASSAIEGRNSSLSLMHHHHRGLPKHRYKVWTMLHNFDCHASDGSTPAARFFQRIFPDLFETVLATIDDLPRPRQRKPKVVLSDVT